MNDLHAQIMNIQCQKVPAFAFASGDVGPEQLRAYKAGHRDARHAAAELALKAVAQPVPPAAWQPIETAPRTGVRVLYLSNEFGEYVGNHPPKCAPGDWSFIDGVWGGSANRQAATATHWMPLPAPPTKE